MLVKDLQAIVELMALADKKYPCVKIERYKAYSTNGGAISCREVSIKDEGFIDKHFLPQLKGILATNKGNEFLEESIAHLIISDFEGFPVVDMSSLFNSEFKYEIQFDAKLLEKVVKTLKGKDNKIIMKIVDNKSPFLVVHENGKALIAPLDC